MSAAAGARAPCWRPPGCPAAWPAAVRALTLSPAPSPACSLLEETEPTSKEGSAPDGGGSGGTQPPAGAGSGSGVDGKEAVACAAGAFGSSLEGSKPGEGGFMSGGERLPPARALARLLGPVTGAARARSALRVCEGRAAWGLDRAANRLAPWWRRQRPG